MEHVPFSSRELKNSKLVIESLLESIRSGDVDLFREILAAHLMTINKVALAKKAGIGRRTLYDMIDPDRKFNPELTTVSALLKALAA